MHDGELDGASSPQRSFSQSAPRSRQVIAVRDGTLQLYGGCRGCSDGNPRYPTWTRLSATARARCLSCACGLPSLPGRKQHP